jgi:hypothetical protein
MPWLIKQIKNGHFDYGNGHIDTALNHAKNGDYDTADTYIDFPTTIGDILALATRFASHSRLMTVNTSPTSKT